MVIVGTKIVIGDNSGARFGRVIRVLGSNLKKRATIGDKVVISVLNASTKKKVKVHDVCLGIVIRQSYSFFRFIGTAISFFRNYIVLIDKKREIPLGTRIFGPFLYEFRRKKYLKLLNLATSIV